MSWSEESRSWWKKMARACWEHFSTRHRKENLEIDEKSAQSQVGSCFMRSYSRARELIVKKNGEHKKSSKLSHLPQNKNEPWKVFIFSQEKNIAVYRRRAMMVRLILNCWMNTWLDNFLKNIQISSLAVNSPRKRNSTRISRLIITA